MDKRIQIKEEEPLADDQASQDEREFVHDVVPMNTSIDAVLVDTDCDGTVKTEVKLETPFIKTETATCSNNWEEHRETEIEHQTLFSDFGSQSEGEFLPEDPLMLDKEYNYHEIHNKIEIKEEPWSLETETSSVCDNIKDGDLFPVNSSRLYTEKLAGAIGKSPVLSELPARNSSSCNGMDQFEYEKRDVTEILAAKEDVQYEENGNCSDGRDTYIQPLYMELKSLGRWSRRPQQCSICAKSFSRLCYLKSHILIHEGKKPHQCEVCNRSFTLLSSLKRHNLIHEGRKIHQCTLCDKTFTQLSNLKRHNLIHEGKKPHGCKVCGKKFSQLSHLKTHNLIHEGKKPHRCKVCDKSFTDLSAFKRHNLIHEGKKPHQCKVCDRSFTDSSALKTHNLIHEDKRPHQCEVCDKCFTQLSTLKRHKLIHEREIKHSNVKCKLSDSAVNLGKS